MTKQALLAVAVCGFSTMMQAQVPPSFQSSFPKDREPRAVTAEPLL
jgi:hypothetical protein